VTPLDPETSNSGAYKMAQGMLDCVVREANTPATDPSEFNAKLRAIEKSTLPGWRKILCDAAMLIEEHGWIQHRLSDKNGFCIHGAIDELTAKQPHQRKYAKAQLRKVLPLAIAEWNDNDRRTKAQVVATLRTAAYKGLPGSAALMN
jgi:hypothetical protein